MIEPLVLLMLIGAVAVFTRIVYIADIATPLRNRIWAKGTKTFLGRLIQCPWCIAPYFATPITFITFGVNGLLGTVSGFWHAMLTAAAVSFIAPWLVAVTKEV